MVFAFGWIVTGLLPFSPSTPTLNPAPECHDANTRMARPTAYIEQVVMDGENQPLGGAMITPAPVLPRRANLKRAVGGSVGWLSSGGSYIEFYCQSGETWNTKGTLGGCCGTQYTYCTPITTCSGDAYVYDANTVLNSCTSPAVCNTHTVWPSSGAAQSWFWIGCHTIDGPIYEVSPTVVVTETQGPSLISLLTITPTPVTVTEGSMTETVIPASTNGTGPQNTAPASKSVNVGAIVGGVIGGVAVVGLAALAGIWLCLKYRGNRDVGNTNVGTASGNQSLHAETKMGYPASNPATHYYNTAMGAHKNMPSGVSSPELYAPQGPAELPAGIFTPHPYNEPIIQELPAQHHYQQPGPNVG